ncbi:MAG: hypothetical protein JRH20_07345 [Deltaproteobacteria bacterium]|nr:hypothetical protein [Deltaproteobacteria bacterium]
MSILPKLKNKDGKPLLPGPMAHLPYQVEVQTRDKNKKVLKTTTYALRSAQEAADVLNHALQHGY